MFENIIYGLAGFVLGYILPEPLWVSNLIAKLKSKFSWL